MENTISFNTKFGWISATEINEKISKIQFCKEKPRGNSTKNLRILKKNFIYYFRSKKKQIKVPIKISGNTIQKKIWNELKKIRIGKTRTYGEIAKKLRISPRYVGRVCGENKHIIVIPCHRVIRSDGSMGGFSANGGIVLKKKLLEFESRKTK
jgi:methylated-DNA-[protein]-cysteine S-methyltransferase